MMAMVLANVHQHEPDKAVTYESLVRKSCADDPVFFANGFVWGDDPNETDRPWLRRKPIVLWAEQEQAILNIRRGITTKGFFPMRKGRKVLGTYIGCMEFLRGWLFLDESYLVVTRTMELLKGPSTASVFGKIKDILRQLPHWMHPPRWTESQAKGYSTQERIVKPLDTGGGVWVADGPVIQGIAATENASVGGRYAAMMVDEAPVIDAEHPGRVRQIVGRSVDTVNLVYLPGTPRGRTTLQAQLMNADADEFSEFDARPVYRMDLNWTKDPKKNKPLFTIPYRPQNYNTLREYYGTLFKCWQLEQAGETESADYRRLRGGCDYLDPERDAAELKRVFSPWYLKECLSRAMDDEDSRLIKTEVDGGEEDDEQYLFSPTALANQPVREPLEYGNFGDIQENHPFIRYNGETGKVHVWKRPATNDEDPRYYVITTDSSGGVGIDYSVAMVWDVTETPVEQVAMIRSDKVGPIELGRYVWALWKWYGKHSPPFVCPETNKEGLLTIATMIDMGVDPTCIYKHGQPRGGEVGKFGYLSAGKGEQRRAVIVGFQELFDNPAQPIVIHSERTKFELSRIPSDKEKNYQPETGHDDCVIAAALVRPALLRYNKQLFGRELFDPVGWKMAERKDHDVVRKAQAQIRKHEQQTNRNQRVPIYRTRERARRSNIAWAH
jgi:hypothetical protein